MLTNQDKPTFLYDLNKIEQWIQSLKPSLEQENIGLIIGIMRGGAYPALLISHMTDLPVKFVRFDRTNNEAIWEDSSTTLLIKKILENKQQILLCEDIAGSGYTLVNCIKFIQQHGIDPIVLTLVHDEKSRINPKYSNYMPLIRWLLPWERHTVNSNYQKLWGTGINQHIIKDNDYNYIGLDLDGIFCEDVPDYLYNHNLSQALLLRSQLECFTNYPKYNPEKAVIVTARPDVDYDVTHNWLIKNNIQFNKLMLRNIEKYPINEKNIYNSARFKADMCLEHFLLEFYESDAAQAILIASFVPHVKVIHWNHQTSKSYIVNSLSVQNII